MNVGSDYQDRNFGKNYGMLIEELKLLSTRRVRARRERQGGLCRDRQGSHQRAELRRGAEGAQGRCCKRTDSVASAPTLTLAVAKLAPAICPVHFGRKSPKCSSRCAAAAE